MAALIGTVQGSRGETHRLGSQYITSHLASWTHAIDTTLNRDGSYSIVIKELHGKVIKELNGNVNNK
jgi:hypothetical protein